MVTACERSRAPSKEDLQARVIEGAMGIRISIDGVGGHEIADESHQASCQRSVRLGCCPYPTGRNIWILRGNRVGTGMVEQLKQKTLLLRWCCRDSEHCIPITATASGSACGVPVRREFASVRGIGGRNETHTTHQL